TISIICRLTIWLLCFLIPRNGRSISFTPLWREARGGFSRTRLLYHILTRRGIGRGTARVEWMFVFSLAVYNLVQMRNLARPSPDERRTSPSAIDRNLAKHSRERLLVPKPTGRGRP